MRFDADVSVSILTGKHPCPCLLHGFAPSQVLTTQVSFIRNSPNEKCRIYPGAVPHSPVPACPEYLHTCTILKMCQKYRCQGLTPARSGPFATPPRWIGFPLQVRRRRGPAPLDSAPSSRLRCTGRKCHPLPGAGSQVPSAQDAVEAASARSPGRRRQPVAQPMATPALGLLLALGLPLLPALLGRAWGQATTALNTSSGNGTTPPSTPSPRGLSPEAITAIIVVFSILAALLLAMGLVLLVRKLREKRQTEGTYRPSSEEQFSHAAEAQAPQDSKEKVRGCLPI
uniref:protein crumbs homolog 3 isoform X3 n=1 Tax=Ictidomys tridecemlineatus TaxID=43179 RepID=UPI001A9CC6C5|nr:protein crumbs homolog 3 isoform X3 [Ictidomys tridecemlineatus]XP_040146513.1 protein crumbs homolog 3 isoform X3 [Ictidomys tridecemlineatus]